MFKRLIFTALMFCLGFITAQADEVTHAGAQTTISDNENHPKVANSLEHSQTEKEHSGSFDPVEIIMHHVADANEFHILGNLSMPLPVFIYNTDKKNWFFSSSSAFHAHHGNGEVEVDGYKMEHSRVHPVDGSHIIDFSITKNVFTMLLGMVILFFIFFKVKNFYTRNGNVVPKGIASFLEPLFQFVAHDIARENIGKNYMKFVPYLVCVFFFILINLAMDFAGQ